MIGGAKLTGLETLVFEEQPTKPFRSASVKKNQVGLMKRKSEYTHRKRAFRIHYQCDMEGLTDVLIFDSPMELCTGRQSSLLGSAASCRSSFRLQECPKFRCRQFTVLALKLSEYLALC